MARRKKAVAGLISELSAQLNLAKYPNILVFTPLGGLGPIDIVTLNMTLSLKILENKTILQKMVIKEKPKELLLPDKLLKNKKN